MRRSLAALLLIPVLLVTLAAPAAAKAPGSTHVHWVPEPMGPGSACGVDYVSMVPTGYADFWFAPQDGPVSKSVQHWNGTMTFTAANGRSVTLRENDWRYVTDTYYEDGTGYSETARYVGTLEELTASDSRARIADTGTAVIATENLFAGGIMIDVTETHVLALTGHVPMRASGFDTKTGGWTKECAFFKAHLQ